MNVDKAFLDTNVLIYLYSNSEPCDTLSVRSGMCLSADRRYAEWAGNRGDNADQKHLLM